MIGNILLYAGSIVIILWGVSHIIPTKSVINGFGAITDENKLIITMEWVAEGFTLCFVGILVLYVTLSAESGSQTSIVVYRASALMLILLAAWTGLTGARTSILPMKICPVVKTVAAALFILGSTL